MTNEITTTSVPKELELKIKTAIELKKQLDEYEKEIKETLLKAMLQNDIQSIKNDTYTISLAKRVTFKVNGDVPKEFEKVSLDQTKVSNYFKLYGELPENIKSNESKYITWRVK